MNLDLVKILVTNYIDKFNKKQEQQAIEYVYTAAGFSYGFFSRYYFQSYYSVVQNKFEDWEAVKKIIVDYALSDPLRSEYTLSNLAQDRFSDKLD